MKKSIGFKIFSTLIVLAALFGIAMLLNIAALGTIQDYNSSIHKYTEMQQAKITSLLPFNRCSCILIFPTISKEPTNLI